ncbi:hypothetical protein AURDEDRAFT_172735 [Auricularia subglabra TFB-10046 SS5]|nr:hypothetical protein AURDEDRAFT_172735 [Auricularia subglabra TFB-10046 SS5]
MFYSIAGAIVDAALRIGGKAPSKRAHSNKSFGDHLGRWPSDVSQLFPLGERDTVCALLTFAETYTCPSPIFLLASLVHLARGIVWPILTSEPNRRRLLLILVALLTPSTDRPRWLSDPSTPVELGQFLAHIRAGPDSRGLEYRQLVGDDSEILLTAIASALDKLPDSSAAVPEFSFWCSILYHDLPKGKVPPPQRALDWVGSYMRTKPPSLGLTLESTVACLKRVRACVCCGISSLRKEDAKALSFCAGCKVALYCSRSCQKQHWQGNGDSTSHRAICPILRRIDGLHTYDGKNPEAFVDAFREIEPGLTADETKLLKQWISETRRALSSGGSKSLPPDDEIGDPEGSSGDCTGDESAGDESTCDEDKDAGAAGDEDRDAGVPSKGVGAEEVHSGEASSDQGINGDVRKEPDL